MPNRREVLIAGGAMAATTLLRPTSMLAQQTEPPAKPGLRTITYNILKCSGYPATADNKAVLAAAARQIPTRLALELGLYQPDIVSFQEAPSEQVVAAIASQMEMNYVYFPGGFPGAILTRFQVLDSRNCPLVKGTRPADLFTRHWGWALLKTENEELPVYSAHLHPSDDAVRGREIAEVLAVLRKDIEADRSLLFQGDLNHKPDGADYPRWINDGLVDSFVAKGTGQPLTFTCTELEKRIDYVFCRGPLAKRLQECRVLLEGQFRTNPVDPRSFALSDHMPVMATFDPVSTIATGS